MILETEDDLEIVGEARNGGEAVAMARRLRPDVVLKDVRMPGTDRVEATRQLTALDPPLPSRVLALTTYDLDEYVFAALRAGAAGFMLKHASSDAVVEALRTVARGEGLLTPEITRRVIEAFATVPQPAGAPPSELERLTTRERDVFDLLMRGLSNTQIAEALYVEPTTVKTHVAHALAKLRLSDRVAAVLYAYDHGLVPPGPW